MYEQVRLGNLNTRKGLIYWLTDAISSTATNGEPFQDLNLDSFTNLCYNLGLNSDLVEENFYLYDLDLNGKIDWYEQDLFWDELLGDQFNEGATDLTEALGGQSTF